MTSKTSMEMKKYKIGIALAGGGARGVAHIGVLAALAEEGIHPEIIAGSSAGSIVGALYAAGVSTDEMLKHVRKSSIMKTLSFRLRGVASHRYLKKMLKKLIKTDSFDALQKPLYVTMTNLNSGKVELVNKGQLFDVVAASSSIPSLFRPIKMNGNDYVDGGVIRNLPARDIRAQCDFLIGVDIMPNVDTPSKKMRHSVSIAMRTFELLLSENSQPDIELCDVVITPKRIIDISILRFNKSDLAYQIGYEATKARMEEIKKMIAKKGVVNSQ